MSCQESLENLTYCKSNYVQQVDISTWYRCGLDSKKKNREATEHSPVIMWFFLILAVSFCGLLTTTAKVIGGGWGDDSGRFSFFSPFPLGTCTATLYSDTILQGDQVFYIVKETGRS